MLTFTIPPDDWNITLPPPAIHTSAGFDVDKVCRGIALAETGGCRTGMAVTKNNCHGIMSWPNGKRTGRRFANHEESQRACVDLWSRAYRAFPNLELAKKYTGADRAASWLKIVTDFYNS